jgi:uncharacterized SAM-binding protein YcdF (DUF218 family)
MLLPTALIACAALTSPLAAALGRRLDRRRRLMAWAAPLALALVGLALTGDAVAARKVVGRLLLPTGLLSVALLGASCRALHRGGRGAVPLLVLAAAYWLAGNVYIGGLLVGWLEGDYVGAPAAVAARGARDEGLDAVALLGGGLGHSPAGTAQLTESGDRVLVWARAARESGAAVAVACGLRDLDARGRVLADTAAESCALLPRLAARDGVACLVENETRNTREEAERLGVLARERGWARVGVVTSAWHMRRALRLCARAGVPAVPIPADFRGGLPPPLPFLVVPGADGFALVSIALWEIYGVLADG